jgi:hypothetical protein
MKRRNLNKAQLLCEQESYDIFAKKIPVDISKRFFKVVIEFDEKSVFDLYQEGDIFYTKDIIEELDRLDQEKPIENTSHVFLLFYELTGGWGSRGTPFLWGAMAREFSNIKMPISKEKFRVDYLEVYKKLTGCDLTSEKREYFFVKNFSHGGISTGVINVDFFRGQLEKIMKLL